MTTAQPKKSCPVYTVNFSGDGVAKIQLAPLDFADAPIPIRDFAELPRTGALILYIVAHAVPNALKLSPPNLRLLEASLVEQLAKVRGGDPAKIRVQDPAEVRLEDPAQSRKAPPTLVILDACFAQTFQEIAGGAWPKEFGLIFSCRAFERAWHSGAPLRQSLFSDALNRAMAVCLNKGSTATLEIELKATLGELQVPVVTDSAYEFLNEILGLPRY
jgi:hypothetical protein